MPDFQGRLAPPQRGVITPPLALSFTQARLCDTAFCNILRDNCAIPAAKKTAQKSFAILSLQVMRDIKSEVAGPLSGQLGCWTMEMNGGSSASYLARTPRVPLFRTLLIGVNTEGLLAYQGRAGIISIVRWNLLPVIFGVEPTGKFCFSKRA